MDQTGSLIFGNLDDSKYQIGIDLFFFKVNSYDTFKGIKLIEPGAHLVHVTDLENNVRIGQFITINPESLYILNLTVLDSDTGEFTLNIHSVEREHWGASGFNEGVYVCQMTTYKKGDNYLLDGIPYTRYIANSQGLVSSSDPSASESVKLDEEIMKRQDQKSRSDLQRGLDKLNESQLNLTVIRMNDKKTFRRPNSMTPTEDYLDRGWLIESKFGDLVRFIDEFRFSFVMMMIMNNYGCYIQWKILIDLFLRSKSLLESYPNESLAFCAELKKQLKVISVSGILEQAGESSFQIEMTELGNSFQECLLNVDEATDIRIKIMYDQVVALLNNCFNMDISDSLGEE